MPQGGSLFDWYNGGGQSTDQPVNQQPQTLTDWYNGGSDQKVKKKEDQQVPQQPVVEQKPLPEGATGFDPFGEPYFGEGISGILKKWKYNFTKDVKPVSEDDWNDLRDRWNQSMHTTTHTTGEFASEQWNQIKMMGEAVSKVWQEGESDGSLISPILKATSASITAIGELFNLPAQKFEQTLGAAQGLHEASKELQSPLPRLDGWADNMVHANPLIGLTYDVARIALSPNKNKWDKTGKAISDGWQAGRIFYSQVFDHTLKEKFLQEYHEGKDPGLLAMKYQNPLAELGGQFVLDPLNLAGAFLKGAKTAKELDIAFKEVAESGLLKIESGKAALKAIQDAVDPKSAIRALEELTSAQKEVVQNIEKTSRLLNVGYTADSLTTASRQNAVVTKGKTLLYNMAMALKEEGMSYDAVANAVLDGIRSVSKNEDEMRMGLSGLANVPHANMWLGDDYVEQFVVLRNMLADGDGVIRDGGQIRKLMQTKGPAEFADAAQKLFLSAAKGEFKDVSELEKAYKTAKEAESIGGIVSEETAKFAQQYEQLPNYVKTANRINEIFKGATAPINRVLFPAYFNLQGGVAVRNVISNNELIFLDKGPSAWFRNGKYWSVENVRNFITDIYGMLPESAHGFKSLVSAVTDRPAWGFGKLMEKGEESAAVRIVGASIRDTFKKMMPAAFPDLSKEVEAGILTQKQSGKLFSLIEKNNYNVKKAIQEFRDLYKVGMVEDWRNLDFVSDYEKAGLEGLDLWKEIEDLAQRGANSTGEVEAVFEKLKKVIDDRASHAVKDSIGISPDHPAIEAWGDLARAAEEGHLGAEEQHVFTAVMEAAEQARLEYQTLLDDVALKAMQTLNLEGRAQEATALGQRMNQIRDTLRKAGPVTARQAHEITQDAWRWTEEIKRLKRPKPEQLAQYWTRAGLEGVVPADLNRKSLLKAIWEQRFNKVSDLWNSSFDAVVASSEEVLRQMGSVVDTTELESMASRTRWVTQQAQAYRGAVYQNGALKIVAKADLEKVAEKYGTTVEEIVNAINNEKGTAYKTIEEIPTRDIAEVFKKSYGADLGVEIPAPHALGTEPTAARAWNESAKGAKYVLDNIKNEIIARWGKTNAERVVSPEMEAVLSKVSSQLEERLPVIKATALRIAEQQRKFTLLDYGEKTYGDVAKAYIMPFHFFYTRSYKNWVYRIAQSPQIVSHYAQYRDFLEKENANLPDWYKQQLDVTKLLGIQTDHPLFVNLEASLNPLYGLTGTDYNDRIKRNNWWTATVDDLGKFGPSIYAPIQLAIAAILYHQGETEVAAHWAGRLFPETTAIKAASSYLLGHPVELDPAVQFFSGGIDPQERGRMSYAAAQLIQSGQFTPEQIMMDFQAQSGAAWDAAYQIATQSRAGSNLLSYFLGVGFKPRSESDIKVEEMYTDLNKLYAMRDYMDAEHYRMAWEALRSKYPDGFVDTILLAKKGGDDRDAALAYNVLGRIPPGDMSQALAAIGLSNEEISKFYDSKGFTDEKVKFTPQEKNRFMAAVLDLAAMLKIPDSATREEWTAAKSTYSQVYKDIAEALGNEKIWDEVSHYYDLKDDNRDAADQFAQLHPEIFTALQMKREAVVNDPLLSAYYGGIETIEAYLDGKIRQQLSNKYGANIYDIQSGYYAATNPKAFLREHPELRQFWNDKHQLEAQNESLFYQFASKLPEGEGAQFQEGFTPQSYTQEQLYNALQQQPKIPSWEEVSQGMPDWLQQEIANYAQRGTRLSTRGQKEMDFLADVGGYYNADELLRMAVLAMQQPLGQPANQQSLVDWFNGAP